MTCSVLHIAPWPPPLLRYPALGHTIYSLPLPLWSSNSPEFRGKRFTTVISETGGLSSDMCVASLLWLKLINYCWPVDKTEQSIFWANNFLHPWENILHQNFPSSLPLQGRGSSSSSRYKLHTKCLFKNAEIFFWNFNFLAGYLNTVVRCCLASPNFPNELDHHKLLTIHWYLETYILAYM